MTKLAIVQEREEDKYDHRTALRCWKCDPVNGRVITANDDTVRGLRPPGPRVHVLEGKALDGRDHAIAVVGPSIRGESLGRRDHRV